MTWGESLLLVVLVGPLVLVMLGGAIYMGLEAWSPNWYLRTKARRKTRIEEMESERRKETRGR